MMTDDFQPRTIIDCKPSVGQLYLATSLIFFSSRAVVVIGLFFSELLIRVPTPLAWDAGDAWYHRLLRWDVSWYLSIVEHGYSFSADPTAQSNVAFYPLYPLISFVMKLLLHINGGVALLLVANVAALAVTLLMTKFVRAQLDDEATLICVAFFCFSPVSLFLSTGYPEALCLVWILLSLILLSQNRFVFASAMAALALATRSVGIVMVPVILWEIWRRSNLPLSRMLIRMLICTVVATSGLLIFMAYLEVKFGNPFAFSVAQSAWHEGTFLQRFLAAVALEPFMHTRLRSDDWFLSVLALTILSFWRLRTGISLYAAGTLALPYFTLGVTGSMNRYTLMCFPAFMCLATLCKGRTWLALGIVGIFGALLLGATAKFSQWYWVG
jgi:Gpi18-like mannosyltransferase